PSRTICNGNCLTSAKCDGCTPQSARNTKPKVASPRGRARPDGGAGAVVLRPVVGRCRSAGQLLGLPGLPRDGDSSRPPDVLQRPLWTGCGNRTARGCAEATQGADRRDPGAELRALLLVRCRRLPRGRLPAGPGLSDSGAWGAHSDMKRSSLVVKSASECSLLLILQEQLGPHVGAGPAQPPVPLRSGGRPGKRLHRASHTRHLFTIRWGSGPTRRKNANSTTR